jgi:hypothetical protein
MMDVPYPFDFECSSERLLRRDRELRKRGTKNPVMPIPVNSGQPLFGRHSPTCEEVE